MSSASAAAATDCVCVTPPSKKGKIGDNLFDVDSDPELATGRFSSPTSPFSLPAPMNTSLPGHASPGYASPGLSAEGSALRQAINNSLGSRIDTANSQLASMNHRMIGIEAAVTSLDGRVSSTEKVWRRSGNARKPLRKETTPLKLLRLLWLMVVRGVRCDILCGQLTGLHLQNGWLLSWEAFRKTRRRSTLFVNSAILFSRMRNEDGVEKEFPIAMLPTSRPLVVSSLKPVMTCGNSLRHSRGTNSISMERSCSTASTRQQRIWTCHEKSRDH